MSGKGDRRGTRGHTGRASRAVALAIGFGVMGCQLGGFEVSPNPPAFRPLPREQIRSTMWRLAAEVQELERLLGSEAERTGEAQRALVIAALERMRTAAGELDQPGRSSQHPMLDRNLPAFTDRLRRARRDVERDPPRYFVAGTVAGACLVCHGQRVAAIALPPVTVSGLAPSAPGAR